MMYWSFYASIEAAGADLDGGFATQPRHCSLARQGRFRCMKSGFHRQGRNGVGFRKRVGIAQSAARSTPLAIARHHCAWLRTAAQSAPRPESLPTPHFSALLGVPLSPYSLFRIDGAPTDARSDPAPFSWLQARGFNSVHRIRASRGCVANVPSVKCCGSRGHPIFG
jgi:hypothetical protein